MNNNNFSMQLEAELTP